MTAAAAIIREGARASFADRGVQRRYLALALVPGLALVVAWPRGSLAAVLPSGGPTDTLLWVSLGLLLSMLYLNVRLGAEEYSPESASHVRDYTTLTPVSLASVVLGKLLFGVLHTLFLAALGAPFLIASLAASGAGWDRVGESLAVIVTAALAARLYGLLLLALTGTRALLRTVVGVPGVIAYLTLTFAFAPDINPVQVLVDVARDPSRPVSGGVSPVALSVGAALVSVGVLAAATLVALRVLRQKAVSERRGDD